MDYAWLSDFGNFLASSEERFSAFVLPAHVGDATVAEEAFRVSVAGLHLVEFWLSLPILYPSPSALSKRCSPRP